MLITEYNVSVHCMVSGYGFSHIGYWKRRDYIVKESSSEKDWTREYQANCWSNWQYKRGKPCKDNLVLSCATILHTVWHWILQWRRSPEPTRSTSSLPPAMFTCGRSAHSNSHWRSTARLEVHPPIGSL